MNHAYPDQGGCWYCHTIDEHLVFCHEFDTYIHIECIRKKLEEEMLEKGDTSAELSIIAEEFKVELSKVEYGLVDSFLIDNGELNGLKPNEIFVLGVEWHKFASEIDNNMNEFQMTVHTHNLERLKAVCNRRGRAYRIKPTEYEEWTFFCVKEFDL